MNSLRRSLSLSLSLSRPSGSNEGFGGLSILFADDFTPDLVVRSNVVFENNCAWNGSNCAVFMMKSVNITVEDNIVADSNYSSIFEISPYRMPAANMVIRRNLLFNTSQRQEGSWTQGGAYTGGCKGGWNQGLDPSNATLRQLISTGDQRTVLEQFGFTDEQLAWPVISEVDGNFASDLSYLRSHGCAKWDGKSIALKSRPFAPAKGAWHSRTALNYAVAPDSELVTKHGFRGSFNVSAIGLTPAFTFEGWEEQHRRRDAYGLVHAERYDRTSNLWTLQATGLGSGTSSEHFHRDPVTEVPSGSWARYDAVDFGESGRRPLFVSVLAQGPGGMGGATIVFQLESPDSSGIVLASVVVPANTTGFVELQGTISGAVPPASAPVFMVFRPAPPTASSPELGIGAIVDWFSFS